MRDAIMTLKDEIKRVRGLSDQARRLNDLKRKVAEDFDKGLLDHPRLDMYLQEREKILQGVRPNIKI
jgi:hypothetical protein